jgi:hypothetical protein
MKVSDSTFSGTVEVVRGRLDDDLAAQLVTFWAREGVLDEATARERLPDVVCVLRSADGAVAGVNSVYAADVPPIGRTFWIYRSTLAPEAHSAAAPAMVHSAFNALQSEFDPSASGPVGLCVLVEDREEIERRPEAQWLWPWLMYAGYLGDGRQVRIRYFDAALIGEPRQPMDFGTALDRRYRIDLFAEQDAVDADAVIDLWAREGAVPPEVANRRVHEVLLVATLEGSRELVAVSTAYLERNPQLRMDLWYLRSFVAVAHRMTRVGWALGLIARDHLQRRFVGGQDLRGAGALFEIENEGLMRRFGEAVWLPQDFTFIGENARGQHVRVHFFPGATVPGPP